MKDTDLTITAGGGSADAVSDGGMGGGMPGQEQSTTQDQDASGSSDDSSSPKGMDAAVAMSIDSGTVEIDAADEGLQAAALNINGGTVSIHSGDDGINASNSSLVIEGYEDADSESDDGSVYTQSSGTVTIDNVYSDGLDSNGSAHVTGGLLVVEGAVSAPESAVDVNGDVTAVGMTVSLDVTSGDTVTVTGDDGSTQTFTATLDTDTLVIVGLTDGTGYTVTTSSGGSATGTASSVVNAGGMGGMGGPGGSQGGPGNRG